MAEKQGLRTLSKAEQRDLEAGSYSAKRLHQKSNVHTREYDEHIAAIDWERRNRCRASLLEDLKTYRAGHYTLEFSPSHYELIQSCEDALLGRSSQPVAFFMPRGSGKSAIAVDAIDWAVRHGHLKPAWGLLIAPEDDFFKKALADLRHSYELPYTDRNLLAIDFPELCDPVRAMAKVVQNARRLHFDGQWLGMQWGASEIVFPSTPHGREWGSGGGRISGGGILSAIRGARRAVGGKIIRPAACLADDIETDTSAKSSSEIKTRLGILRSGVKGLAGPDKRLRFLLAGTILQPDCATDRISDGELPQFSVIRKAMIRKWPNEMDLWLRYAEIIKLAWAEKRPITEAQAFYDDNQEQMDAGCVVYWEDRIIAPYRTAIQTALSLWIEDPQAFASEYQNEPTEDQLSEDVIYCDRKEILAKRSVYSRRVVPDDAEELVAFVDVQLHMFVYGVMGVAQGLKRWSIDLGTWPDQRKPNWRKSSLAYKLSDTWSSREQAWEEGLKTLFAFLTSISWQKPSGMPLHITRGLVDASDGEHTDIVYRVCRDFGEGIWLPSHGVGITASSKPLNEGISPKKYKMWGPYWNRSLDPQRRMEKILYDANFWKTTVHGGIRTPATDEGTLILYNGEQELTADHLRAEYPVKTSGRGRDVIEWKDRPNKPDNEALDILAGASVAASIQKFCLPGHEDLYRKPRKPRKTWTKEELAAANAKRG